MSWPDSPPTQPPAQPPTEPVSVGVPRSEVSETSRTTSPSAVRVQQRPRRARMIIGIVLLFLAGVSATFGVASFWTARAILDEDTWVATSKAIVNNPQVQDDVARAIATQIVTVVGIDDLVGGVLPGPLGSLSGTVTQGVTDLITLATVQVVKTDAFVSVWESAVRATHEEFVRAVDGSGRIVTIDSEGLSLDLGSSLVEIEKQLNQRGIDILDNVNLSSIDLQVPLVDAPGLERIQTWIQALRVGSIVFPAVAVIAAMSGLLVARRRWFAVMAAAVGVVVGAGVIALITSAGRDRAIEEISGGVLGVSSAGVIVDEVVSGLDRALLVACALAAVALVASLIAAVLDSRNRSNVPDDVSAPAA
ncbi:unannotated protein [freshwater metagenome]|uniref:Unannotated protein n=1 Tax=freshwater metagenome TaxID=449393 RepID=A0A6J6D5K3_9ZZZZ